jgi:spore coat protein CotH
MKRVQTILLGVALLALRPSSAAAQPPDTADALFNDSVLHEIRLSVNSKDWQFLKDHVVDDTHYPADFRWNDKVVRNVSIKSHGAGSRRPNKPSLKVGFNHYTTGQTFLGLQSVLLRNNSQDKTNMHERLSMLFFRHLGLVAQREAHTRLYVNDEYLGLYTICEEYDTDFLQKNLGENSGHLYEYKFDDQAAFAGQPPFSFQYLGPDPALYVPSPFEPKTLENDPQGEAIVRFVQAVSDTGAAAWRTMVSQYLDLEKFIRHVAIENFLAEEDGLTGDYGVNNFYLYRFANTTMFRFLPWDKSNTFWSTDYPVFHNIADGPVERRNLLVLRAFQEPDLLDIYLRTLLEAADSASSLAGASPDDPPFDQGWLEREVNREYDQIHDAALADTILFNNDDFELAAADLEVFARDRSGAVRAQVAPALRALDQVLGR